MAGSGEGSEARMASLHKLTALEQGAEDRRVDIGPEQFCGLVVKLDFVPAQRQGFVIIEQTAIEPGHRFKADRPASLHRSEQGFQETLRLFRLLAGMLNGAFEHRVRQQAHILSEHAEDETVDDMCDGFGAMAILAQALASIADDTREWFFEHAEQEERFSADAEGLERFLYAKVMPYFRSHLAAAEGAPTVRLQAWGESLDPFRMDKLLALDECLTRQAEKVMAMPIKLQSLRPGARPKATNPALMAG